MGDSILYWAGRRAVDRRIPNLNLKNGAQIGWKAVRGMSWDDFHHVVQREMLFSAPPKIILIHLGGNDLHRFSLFKLRRLINREIDFLFSTFPSTIVIWCDIIQRRSWRGNGQKINIVMEKKRRRVNGFGKKAIGTNSRGRSCHVDIDYATVGFYRQDGVHLSDVGLEMLLDTIQDVLNDHLC